MLIAGLIKNSFVDYRGKVAAVIFTPGCNLNCYYCHNRDIIATDKVWPEISEKEIFHFLDKRKILLDGIVISGGEPTLQADLVDFIQDLSFTKLPIKLDTNGTNPTMLKELIEKNLVDYIAMDIKAPLNKYENISGVKIDLDKIIESIELLKSNTVEYEFRTTVVPEIDSDDLLSISNLINGATRYVLQQYKPQARHKKVIDLRSAREPHKPSFFIEAKRELDKVLEVVEIKGI